MWIRQFENETGTGPSELSQRLLGLFLGAGKKLANRELNDGNENGKNAIG